MGNLIYSQDFISVADGNIDARSSTVGYNKIDIMDYWHLKARHRAADLTKSDEHPLFVIDFGSAKTPEGIYLSDINYDKVRIYGDDVYDDTSVDHWNAGGADYDSGELDVTQNGWTGRYQIYIPLDSFNNQYLAIMTPSAASAVGSYTTFWETGCVAIFDSVTTMGVNMGWPLRQTTEELFAEVGRSGRVSLNSTPGWIGEITFGEMVRSTNEDYVKTLGRAAKASPIFIYLNQGDDSEAYLCLMDQGYTSEWFSYDAARGGQAIRFRELIGA